MNAKKKTQQQQKREMNAFRYGNRFSLRKNRRFNCVCVYVNVNYVDMYKCREPAIISITHRTLSTIDVDEHSTFLVSTLLFLLLLNETNVVYVYGIIEIGMMYWYNVYVSIS